jgi:hypothetical protein
MSGPGRHCAQCILTGDDRNGVNCKHHPVDCPGTYVWYYLQCRRRRRTVVVVVSRRPSETKLHRRRACCTKSTVQYWHPPVHHMLVAVLRAVLKKEEEKKALCGAASLNILCTLMSTCGPCRWASGDPGAPDVQLMGGRIQATGADWFRLTHGSSGGDTAHTSSFARVGA